LTDWIPETDRGLIVRGIGRLVYITLEFLISIICLFFTFKGIKWTANSIKSIKIVRSIWGHLILKVLREYVSKRDDVAFLFGSSARGKIRRERDIDVAVYFRPEKGLEWENVLSLSLLS